MPCSHQFSTILLHTISFKSGIWIHDFRVLFLSFFHSISQKNTWKASGYNVAIPTSLHVDTGHIPYTPPCYLDYMSCFFYYKINKIILNFPPIGRLYIFMKSIQFMWSYACYNTINWLVIHGCIVRFPVEITSAI